jgi:hypothetical protein
VVEVERVEGELLTPRLAASNIVDLMLVGKRGELLAPRLAANNIVGHTPGAEPPGLFRDSNETLVQLHI